METKKFDDGKPRYDLIPAFPLNEMAKVYAFGADKYGDNNWRGGLKWGRVFAAIMRHLWAFWRGENADPETGLSHLTHAAWGCFTLLEYSNTHAELDDRENGCGPYAQSLAEHGVHPPYQKVMNEDDGSVKAGIRKLNEMLHFDPEKYNAGPGVVSRPSTTAPQDFDERNHWVDAGKYGMQGKIFVPPTHSVTNGRVGQLDQNKRTLLNRELLHPDETKSANRKRLEDESH